MVELSSTTANLLLIVAAGLAIWLAVTIFQEQKKSKSPIVINFDSKATQGRFFGPLKDIVWGAGDRSLVTFSPKDVDMKKLKKQKRNLIDAELIGVPGKFLSFAEGTLSADVAMYINLPDDPENLDESVKNTPLGVAFQYLIVQQDFVKKRIEILKGKIKNRDELLDEVGDAEMSEELISRHKGFMKDLAEMQLEAMKATKKRYDYDSSSGGTNA